MKGSLPIASRIRWQRCHAVLLVVPSTWWDWWSLMPSFELADQAGAAEPLPKGKVGAVHDRPGRHAAPASTVAELVAAGNLGHVRVAAPEAGDAG